MMSDSEKPYNDILPSTISKNELIVRFIFSSDLLKKGQMWRIFMPHKNQISVFRQLNITNSEVLEIGTKFVEKEIRLKGSITFEVQDVTNFSLQVNAETASHNRHANIENFSADKNANMALALEIAAELKRKNTFPAPFLSQ